MASVSASAGAWVAAASASPRPSSSPVEVGSAPGAKAVPVARLAGLGRRSGEDEAGVLGTSPFEGGDSASSASFGGRGGSLGGVAARAVPRRSGAPPPGASVVGFGADGGALGGAGARLPAVGVAPRARPGLLRRELSGDTVLPTPNGEALVIGEPAVRKPGTERAAQADALRQPERARSRSRSRSRSRADGEARYLADAQAAHPVFSTPLVRKAFAVARAAHDGQLRKSGEPVLAHAIHTAIILAQLGLDETVVAAGLLHDTLDDTMLTPTQLSALFPDSDVPLLVAGVSKMSGASQLHRDAGRQLPADEVDALRAMLLAMADVRVVLIKLADRLHNMRTIGALAPATAVRLAAETLEVFCPLANRLGVWSVKAELEDACFHVLHAEDHAALADGLHSGAEAAGVAAAQAALADALAAAGVRALELSGRPKNLYSIYRKMRRKGLPLAAVHAVLDARALRVIVPDEASCYAALQAVHALWTPLPDKVKDYIGAPKANGYRSLHTVVADASSRPMEVQIRTAEMHAVAEFGVAAHWRYKEAAKGVSVTPAGGSPRASSSSGDEATDAEQDGDEFASTLDAQAEAAGFLEQQVAWARFLLSWESEVAATMCGSGAEAAAASGSSECKFPTHGAACAHAAAWPLALRRGGAAPPPPPPAPAEAPLYVMLCDAAAGAGASAGTLRVLSLPRGATLGDLRAAAGAALLSARRVLVNTQPRDDLSHGAPDSLPLELATGDVIELLLEHGAAPATPTRRVSAGSHDDAVAAERQRLMRIVGLAPPSGDEWRELSAYA